MAYDISNFFDNDDVSVIDKRGAFQVLQYDRDLSCTPEEAVTKYYMSQMYVTKKQLVCDTDKSSVILSPGKMQWTIGKVKATTGLKGVGDAVGKFFSSKVTGEQMIKPEYEGPGLVVCEPTYKHIILLDVSDWGGALTIDDGLFYACEGSIKLKTVARNTVSGAVLGGEGLFNTCLVGRGVVTLECRCSMEELIEITLQNDTIRIDGNYAIAWSEDLKFTVEKSGKSLMGSAVSGEGLVNVYSGSGKILMMPQV